MAEVDEKGMCKREKNKYLQDKMISKKRFLFYIF